MQIIEGMDLAQDNKLPREELLASQLGVSRTTIRQALNNLAAEGVVSRRQGKGTFVNVDSIGIRVTFSLHGAYAGDSQQRFRALCSPLKRPCRRRELRVLVR